MKSFISSKLQQVFKNDSQLGKMHASLSRRLSKRSNLSTATTGVSMKFGNVQGSSSSSLSQIPYFGISCRWLITFVKEDKTISMQDLESKKYKTRDFATRVKEFTMKRKESLAEKLVRKHGVKFVKGIADMFISHCWDSPLIDLINTLEMLIKDLPAEQDLFVWLDICAINQHDIEAREYDQEFWKTTFHKIITNLGKFTMVVTQSNDSNDDVQNLKRSWCLWEMFGATLHERIRADITFPPNELQAFRELLQKSPKKAINKFSVIDLNKAQATNKNDENMIVETAKLVRGGIVAVNERISNMVKDWFIREIATLIKKLENASGNTNKETTQSELAALYQVAGDLYKSKGKLVEAESMLVKCAGILKSSSNGKDANIYASCLNDLAYIVQAQGKFVESEQFYRQSLSAYRALENVNKAELANCLNNFGYLLQMQNKYDESLMILNESLSIRKSIFSNVHEDIAESLNNLALLYQRQGKYNEAESCFSDSLAIVKELYGEEHPVTISLMNSQAANYFMLKKYAEAEQTYQKIIPASTKINGENHQETGQAVSGLAEVYRIQGRYEDSEPLIIRALAIYRKLYGDYHPAVGSCMNNLTLVLQMQGKYEEAKIANQNSLSISRALHGDNHPEVAQCLNNQGYIFQTEGKLTDAERAFEHAITLYKELYGDIHPSVAQCLNNLALVCFQMGNLEKSKTHFKEALEAYKQTYGNLHPYVASISSSLGIIAQEEKEYESAHSYFTESIELYKKIMGEKDGMVAANLGYLAALFQAQQKYEEAERIYREAFEMLRGPSDQPSPEAATCAENLGILLVEMNNLTEAEKFINIAYEIRKEVFGDEDEMTDVSRAMLMGCQAKVLYSEMKSEEASERFTSALNLMKESKGDDFVGYQILKKWSEPKPNDPTDIKQSNS